MNVVQLEWGLFQKELNKAREEGYRQGLVASVLNEKDYWAAYFGVEMKPTTVDPRQC